ncbi:hypothetical protein PanWU01x14_132620 [Parasponia andersonii]|uniref:Transmembrane protein n=1 Tax=Parasponia andersonii TaxID=3476 RepID=A0A2P5CQR0_PARAD|nr:hypothetical protein PanWU01x14_132620 [Parasponia andersonii]
MITYEIIFLKSISLLKPYSLFGSVKWRLWIFIVFLMAAYVDGDNMQRNFQCFAWLRSEDDHRPDHK